MPTCPVGQQLKNLRKREKHTEVRIPSMRQFIFSVLAIGVSVGLYFILRSIVGEAEIGWICILAALPFALCGFVKYNGMTAEKLALAVIRFEYLMLKRLVFRAENLYARALEHSSAMCVQ